MTTPYQTAASHSHPCPKHGPVLVKQHLPSDVKTGAQQCGSSPYVLLEGGVSQERQEHTIHGDCRCVYTAVRTVVEVEIAAEIIISNKYTCDSQGRSEESVSLLKTNNS